MSFKLLYEGILECLIQCQDLPDPETSSKARMLLKTIIEPNFIVALCVLDKILAYSLSLSVSLQMENTDLVQAVSSVKVLTDILTDKRANAQESFSEIWTNALVLANVAGCELNTPRLVARQRHRPNIPADCPQDYYRRTIYIPFLDSMIMQLDTRFVGHSSLVYHLTSVIPAFLIKHFNASDLIPALDIYSQFIEAEGIVLAEVELWQRHWLAAANSSSSEPIPSTAIDGLKACNPAIFPNIHTILTIACTLPVTTASAERSFSSLKRLKSYLRSTMGTERLNGLALLNVHANICITPDEVIDDFAKKPRKQTFTL
jgi:hypothetical protein